MLPFSLSGFATILSSTQEEVRKRLSQAVLFPLAAVILALAAVIGYARGWESLTTLWEDRTTFEQILLAALAIFLYVLIGALLEALQGSVARGFMGVWPTSIASPFRNHHRQLWCQLRAGEEWAAGEYNAMIAARTRFRPRSQPAMLVAGAALAPFEIVKPGDRKTKTATGEKRHPITNEKPIERLPDGPCFFTTRSIAQGDAIYAQDLVRLPTPDLRADKVLLPIVLRRGAVPPHLRPGDQIQLYSSDPSLDPAVTERPWLLVACDEVERNEVGGQSERVVRLTLAMTPGAASSAARFRFPHRFIAAFPAPAEPAPATGE
jgi:hypothetical protein